MSNQELAPCPFCGCAMKVLNGRNWVTADGDHNVSCPFHMHKMPTYNKTDDGVRALAYTWNRRHTESTASQYLWRIAEMWSSSNPGQKSLILARDAQEISYLGRSSYFIRWLPIHNTAGTLEQAAQACDQQADGTNGAYRTACLQCANAVRELRDAVLEARP